VGDEGLAELWPPNGWRLGLIELCRYERGNGLKNRCCPSSTQGVDRRPAPPPASLDRLGLAIPVGYTVKT
jgi:hypothetical protein